MIYIRIKGVVRLLKDFLATRTRPQNDSFAIMNERGQERPNDEYSGNETVGARVYPGT